MSSSKQESMGEFLAAYQSVPADQGRRSDIWQKHKTLLIVAGVVIFTSLCIIFAVIYSYKVSHSHVSKSIGKESVPLSTKAPLTKEQKLQKFRKLARKALLFVRAKHAFLDQEEKEVIEENERLKYDVKALEAALDQAKRTGVMPDNVLISDQSTLPYKEDSVQQPILTTPTTSTPTSGRQPVKKTPFMLSMKGKSQDDLQRILAEKRKLIKEHEEELRKIAKEKQEISIDKLIEEEMKTVAEEEAKKLVSKIEGAKLETDKTLASDPKTTDKSSDKSIGSGSLSSRKRRAFRPLSKKTKPMSSKVLSTPPPPSSMSSPTTSTTPSSPHLSPASPSDPTIEALETGLKTLGIDSISVGLESGTDEEDKMSGSLAPGSLSSTPRIPPPPTPTRPVGTKIESSGVGSTSSSIMSIAPSPPLSTALSPTPTPLTSPIIPSKETVDALKSFLEYLNFTCLTNKEFKKEHSILEYLPDVKELEERLFPRTASGTGTFSMGYPNQKVIRTLSETNEEFVKNVLETWTLNGKDPKERQKRLGLVKLFAKLRSESDRIKAISELWALFVKIHTRYKDLSEVKRKFTKFLYAMFIVPNQEWLQRVGEPKKKFAQCIKRIHRVINLTTPALTKLPSVNEITNRLFVKDDKGTLIDKEFHQSIMPFYSTTSDGKLNVNIWDVLAGFSEDLAQVLEKDKDGESKAQLIDILLYIRQMEYKQLSGDQDWNNNIQPQLQFYNKLKCPIKEHFMNKLLKALIKDSKQKKFVIKHDAKGNDSLVVVPEEMVDEKNIKSVVEDREKIDFTLENYEKFKKINAQKKD